MPTAAVDRLYLGACLALMTLSLRLFRLARLIDPKE